MKKIAALVLSLFLSYGIAFADTPKDSDAPPSKPAAPAKPKSATKTDKSDSAIAAEIEELRQAIQAQQEELQLLKEQLAKRDRQIDEARDAAAAANARAAEASTKATEAVNTTAEVKSNEATINSTVSDLKASNAALSTTVATVAKDSAAAQAKAADENTASIHYKGITFTPGGFIAAESVFRTKAAQGDINTPFTGIPFPGNDLSKVTEFNASGRQSRITFLFEGKADNVKLNGYYEADWLGTGVTSNNRQSNSYVMRQRQIWGQAQFSNGWSVTGGQMWSLATETRKALDNRTEATPMTVDSQYNVGFTWARQYGFRVTKNFNDKAWIGFAAEGSQTTVSNHAGANGTPTGVLVGGVGAGGGLLNFSDTTGYSNNPTPDFVVKAAFEPGRGHYEIFGVISQFRDRVYPCTPSPTTLVLPAVCAGVGGAGNGTAAFNSSATGGGIGVNARLPLDPAKKIELGLHVFGGDGVGRYSSAQLPDATLRPDGTLALIRGGSGLGTLEVHATPKLDVYFDYGVEYAYRAAYTYQTNPAAPAPPVTNFVGYGSPNFNNSGCEALSPGAAVGAPFVAASAGGCTGDLRNIQEGTIGFWHKLYQGPKGGLRWGIQYSYIFKNTWSGNNNTPAAPGVNGKAVDSMVFTSFRYYIP